MIDNNKWLHTKKKLKEFHEPETLVADKFKLFIFVGFNLTLITAYREEVKENRNNLCEQWRHLKCGFARILFRFRRALDIWTEIQLKMPVIFKKFTFI